MVSEKARKKSNFNFIINRSISVISIILNLRTIKEKANLEVTLQDLANKNTGHPHWIGQCPPEKQNEQGTFTYKESYKELAHMIMKAETSQDRSKDLIL